MHKSLFRLLPIFLLCVTSHAWANNPLCPAPKTVISDNNAPEPTPEEYHESMKAAVLSGQNLDWVEAKDANTCGGYYQAPTNPNPEKNKQSKNANMRVSAETVDRAANGYTVFSGDVEVYHGPTRFRSDSMSFSQKKNYAELQGNIQYRENGLLLSADTMQVFGDEERVILNNSQYLLSEENLRGKADRIDFENTASGLLTFEHTHFSSCPADKEHWAVSASELEIDKEEGWGTAKHAVFYLKSIPLMYLPYLDFPIDDRRKTGLLFPTFSTAQGGGLDFNIPIYFNIAPNYDMTYSPRYNADHGILHGLEGRYKNTFSEWQITGAYIDDDKKIGDTFTADNPDIESTRWLGAIKESGQFNDNWSTLINYTAVSDIQYFRDWGNVGLDVQKTLNIKREAQLNYRNNNWAVKSSVVDYQSLDQDPAAVKPYRNWPRVDVFHIGKSGNFTFTPIYTAQYTYFNHATLAQAHRLYNAPGVSYPMSWQTFKAEPTLKIRRTDFDFTGENESTSTLDTSRGHRDITAAMFKLDNRLFLERDFSLANEKITQTLTPRLFYLYSQYEKGQEDLLYFDTTENAFTYNQLFRESRFSGYDRIDDANQLTVALETDLIDNATGSNIISFGIGQILYFRDRDVVLDAVDNQYWTIEPNDSDAIKTIKQAQNEVIKKTYYRSASDIAMSGRWTLSPKSSLIGSMIIDPYKGDGEEGSLIYHTQYRQGYIFNAGYRYKQNIPGLIPEEKDDTGTITQQEGTFNNNSNQIDLSVYLPVFRDWNFFARSNFDINKSERIDSIAGIEYSGCCIGVTLAYQNERKTFEDDATIPEYADASYEYSWHIQFEFKGLGAVNNSLNSILKEQIQGYEKRE